MLKIVKYLALVIVTGRPSIPPKSVDSQMSAGFHIALLQKVSMHIHANMVLGTTLCYILVRVLNNNLANKLLLVLKTKEKNPAIF